MKLYDEIISRFLKLYQSYEVSSLEFDSKCWPEVSDRSMILRSDMAFELGSGSLPAIGSTLITAQDCFVPEDGVFLIGKNLSEITKDTAFARIALVKVKEETLGEGNALYSAIRKLEYTKYHFYPEGFMMRVSSSKQRESVRVGKAAIANGLDFSITGSMMIDAFKNNSKVEAVRIYYVALEDFDYKALEKMATEAEEITKTIDHILNNVMTDCSACSLQEVCDEVEGLRELHFGKKENEMNAHSSN